MIVWAHVVSVHPELETLTLTVDGGRTPQVGGHWFSRQSLPQSGITLHLQGGEWRELVWNHTETYLI